MVLVHKNILELNASIQAGRAQLLDLLAQVPPDRMDVPGVLGDWSVKDLLAHLLVHEQCMQVWIATALAGAHPQGPQPYAMPDAELDSLNAEIWRENRTRPLEGILVDLAAAHQRTLALLDAPASELLFDAARFHLCGGEALWQAVAANTYEHVAEHRPAVLAWLSAQGL